MPGDGEYTAGRFVVAKSPDVKKLGRNATGSKASAEGGSRKQLAAPERRDQAKVKRMLEELHSSQQQGATQDDGADDTMPGQEVDHVDCADAENIDEVPVEQPTKVVQQHLTGDGEHVQSTKMRNPKTSHYQERIRRGLLKAAENGTLPSGSIQESSAVSLGEFWVRLKEELLSKERDQAKIERMLDEWRLSQLQGAEAVDEQPLSAGEGELGKEESSEQRRRPVNDEAEVEMKGQPDMDDDDSDDDVFVRFPRRRRRGC